MGKAAINVATLWRGCVVYEPHAEKFGIVLKDGKSFLHRLRYAKVRWFYRNRSDRVIKYFEHEQKMVKLVEAPK